MTIILFIEFYIDINDFSLICRNNIVHVIEILDIYLTLELMKM